MQLRSVLTGVASLIRLQFYTVIQWRYLAGHVPALHEGTSLFRAKWLSRRIFIPP